MFFDDLLESRVVQLGEFGQVVHVGDDIAQHLLQQQEILVGRRGVQPVLAGAATQATVGGSSSTIQARNHVVDFGLAGLDTADNLLAFDFLEVEDLVQLTLQQRHEVLLIVIGPWLAIRLGVLGRGFGDEVCLESFFQVVVGDVIPVELLDHGRLEVFAEPGTRSERVSRVFPSCSAELEETSYLMMAGKGAMDGSSG